VRTDPVSRIGVYYSPQDYVGVFKRILIDAIDIPVALLLSVAVIWSAMRLTDAVELEGALALCVGVWFGYFVLLKRSPIRTLGYIVAGARIVDLRGDRPGLLRLSARLLLAVLGPFNFVMDLFWLTGDPDRQALRDKFVGTYVVRRQATPAGSGPIVFRTYMFWGMTFLFKEVARPTGPSSTVEPTVE
jgi:uncharacterized RDD family membrane protein YckC